MPDTACTGSERPEDRQIGCYVPLMGGGPGAETRAWRSAVFVVFTLNGVELASWTSRTPTVRDSLHASTTQWG